MYVEKLNPLPGDSLTVFDEDNRHLPGRQVKSAYIFISAFMWILLYFGWIGARLISGR